MATTGKPKTTFVVSYGLRDEAATQAALAPVLIAPRYALIDKSDANAKIGSYAEMSAAQQTADWPICEDGAIVDVSSCELFVRNAVIKLNDTAIVGEVSGNVIKLATDSVKVGGSIELASELNGVEVSVGDVVRFADGGKQYTTKIVDILPSAVDPSAIVSGLKGATGIEASDGGNYKGSKELSYLVTLRAAGDQESLTKGISADITALRGDDGYKSTVTLTAQGTKLSGTGVSLKLTDAAKTAKDGDSFIVAVSPAGTKAFNTIKVSDVLPAVAKANIFFGTGRLSKEYTPLSYTMWDATEEHISVAENATISVGDHKYELIDGDLCVEYRALLTAEALRLFSCTYSEIQDIVGKADPRNPLGMMYACASQVTNGFFYMMATEADTEEAYIKAVEFVGKYEQAYAIVCAKQTAAIQAATKAMINKYSAKEVAKYKRAWFTPITEKASVIYGEDKFGSALIGSITDGKLTMLDPADIIGAGVRGGDIVRVYLSSSESGSNHLYDDYVIDSVDADGSAQLTRSVNRNTSRIEFVRELSSAEFAKALADEARNIASPRSNFVASDKLEWNGLFYDVDRCYLAATLATMRSALPPHAPMNELVVPGFDVHDEYKWTDADYEEMNDGGVWLVYVNDNSDTVTYHQITTCSDGTIAEEDSAVSNGDAIVRMLRTAVRPIASGKANVSSALVNLIDKTLRANIDYIMGINYDDLYGPQILDYSVLSLDIPESNRASIRCKIRLQLPLPLQDGEFEFNLI